MTELKAVPFASTGHHVVGVNFAVGDLDEGSGRRPLSLREACNKIVHATNVEFDLGGGTTTFTDKAGEEVTECIVYLRPTSVELRGNWEDRAWSAELQVYAFIKAATMVTFRYEAALDELHGHRTYAMKAAPAIADQS